MDRIMSAITSFANERENVANTRDKWQQDAIYPAGVKDGEPLLYVPTDDIWLVHETAKEVKLTGQRAIDVAAIAAVTYRSDESLASRKRKLNRQVSEGLIYSWLRKHQARPWFEGWLFRAERPPKEVTIADSDITRRCRKAWDFRRHALQAGL